MKILFGKSVKGICVLIVAAVFLLAGVYRNEAAAVFQKAAAICLECIGIG